MREYKINLLKLDEIIESYDFDTDPVLQKLWLPLQNKLVERIQTYGKGVNAYGMQVSEHLRRTSEDGRDFMKRCLGFSEKAAENFYQANLLQDLGKIHPDYTPTIWSLPNRPTDEERAHKREHTFKGPMVMEEALQDAPSEVREHPHVAQVIPAIQIYHHERVDGYGPFGMFGDQFGLVIKTAAIVDALDGDMIPRPHQERGRDLGEALERLRSGEKYIGAFDPDLLDVYIKYRTG